VRAAYFDVDGTLVRTNLIQPTVMYFANSQTPWETFKRIGGALLDGPRMALAELQDRRLFNEALFSHFKGMSEDRLVELSREVFQSVVKPNLFRGATDLILKTQDAGMRVVLITGSLDVTMFHLADHLNVPRADIIANRLEMKDGYATGKLMRPVVAGPGKAQLIVDDARGHGHDLALCQGYSDSYSDVPMLSVVGHPYCVHPDSKLRQLAHAYNWPILDIDTPARGMLGRI
jgi:HAD superfamily hydrolase (TIGR01490 family)